MLVAFCAIFCVTASAQAAHFAGAMQRLPINGLNSPQRTAVDANGNLYISDQANLRVLKETPQSDGSYLQSVVAKVFPGAIAVDNRGNVFIIDINNQWVTKMVPQSDGSYVAYPVTTTSLLQNPIGIAVDANDNIYISDSVVLKEIPDSTAANTGYTETTVANAKNVPNMQLPDGLAVDVSGNVYIADNAASLLIIMSPQSDGTYVEDTYYDSSSGFNSPTSVAVDLNSNVFVGNSGDMNVLTFNGSAWVPVAAEAEYGFMQPNAGLAVDANDNLYIADSQNNEIIKDSLTGWNFGQVPVGSMSQSVTLIFDIDAQGTFGNTSIVTQGVPGQDFVDSVKGCSSYYTPSGPYCTEGVYFAPKLPGTSYGALNVTSPNSTLATAYLQGVGVGAQVNFMPGTQSVPITGLAATGIAVDFASNIYFANGDGGAVEVVAPGQTLQQAKGIVQGMGSAAGVAIDGNGNVYASDSLNNYIVKITPQPDGGYASNQITTSALDTPEGIAVDGSGNVYIADSFHSRVLKETLWAGSYTESTIASASTNGLSYPYGVAVDGNGNVYIADTSNSRVLKETLSGNNYIQSVLPTPNMGRPSWVTVDGFGSVYIADYDNGQIVKETPSAEGYTPSIASTAGLSKPLAVAVDARGNVYIADNGNSRIVEEDFSDAPTLSFAPTDQGKLSGDSPQTITVVNTGNTSLNFSTISYPFDFPEGDGVTTDCEGTTVLYTNDSCTVTVDFLPRTSNPTGTTNVLNESVVVQDNIFNPAGGAAAQSITVAGSETVPPIITISPATLPGGTVGAAYIQTISASGGTAPYTYTVTNGTLPAGLTLSSNGTLSGTPTASGTYPITVNAADSSTGTGPYSSNQIYQLTVAAEPVAATPTFSVADGAYTSAQTVTILDTTPGARIYYTTDGSTPSGNSYLADRPITVSTTETIQAIAIASGYSNSEVAAAAYAINLPGTPVAATPTFSLATNTYTAVQTLTISDDTTGATIFYTTDGSTPTTSSPKFSGTITVSATEVVQAIAVATGYNNSAVASAAYAIDLPVTPVAATPVFSVATNTYTTVQSVTISDNTTGATIYYTTDGTTPTINSAKFASAIIVSSTETIQAIAVAAGYSNSAIASAAYAINLPGNPVAATPTFSVAAGTYATAQTLTLADTTAGAAVYYTTDGTTPTTSSSLYNGPITVSSTEVVQAVAVASGYNSSAVAVAAYIINLPGPSVAATPTFSVASGSYTTVQMVKISDTTAGSTIYYTTDGSTPTANSTLYSGPITVSSTETIQAIAIASGYTNSVVAAAAYSINLPGTPVAATPAFSVASGNYASVQTVALSESTLGASVYYTTNGSTPTASSNLYSSAITVSATETIQAIAIASGYTSSAVAAAAYSINLPGLPVADTPVFSLQDGVYATAQSVTISDTTPGSAIYYTTDGSTPTTGANFAHGPITVSATETIRAIAVATGYSNSTVAAAAYTISLPQVAAPHFSIGTGTYTSTQTVTITDTTAGATIYYTTDGSTPTTNSNLAGGPITVSSTETLTAIAITGGDTNSEVVWATYTINPAAADFTLSASNTSATMLPASPAVFNLTVTPLNATTFPAALTLVATGLPTGATAVFSPANIVSGSGSTPVTMTISPTQKSELAQPNGGSIVGRLAPFSFALLLLPFTSRLRRSGKRIGRMLTVLLLLVAGAAAVAGMSGCGSTNGIFGQMPKAYTVTVTGTMGSVSHSTTTILIVQ
jgi:sugar lactone lactonase YvrE